MVEIPVLYRDEDTQSLESLGIFNAPATMETMSMTFFRIDCVCESKENGVVYTYIYSGSACFMSPLSKKEVIDIIMSSNLVMK